MKNSQQKSNYKPPRPVATLDRETIEHEQTNKNIFISLFAHAHR